MEGEDLTQELIIDIPIIRKAGEESDRTGIHEYDLGSQNTGEPGGKEVAGLHAGGVKDRREDM